MPPIEEPTLGEVLRGLVDLKKEFVRLSEKIDHFEASAAKTYVRQDVYFAERQAMESNVTDIRSDIATVDAKTNERITALEQQQKADADKRRQTWFAIASLALGFMGLLATVIIAVAKG